MKFYSLKSLLCFFGTLLTMSALTGCGPASKKFTPEDFAKVKPGMPEAQVLEILGGPTQKAEVVGVKRLFWVVGDKYYTASIAEGKVGEATLTTKEDMELLIGLMKSTPKDLK